MEPPLPLRFTLATVTYNAAPLLLKTIQNVEKQTYPYIEHVIIDGSSTDNTLQLLHNYQERNSQREHPFQIIIRSESDRGIYDAMNKALTLATGDYILFLNAGDTLHNTTLLENLAQQIEHITQSQAQRPAIIYGNTDIVDEKETFISPRHLAPPKNRTLSWKDFSLGMLVCHQAFWVSRPFAQEELYNEQYRFSADYDWCIRLLQKAQREKQLIHHAQLTIANYLYEGTTTQNRFKSLKERFYIMCHYYGIKRTFFNHIYFLFRALKANK